MLYMYPFAVTKMYRPIALWLGVLTVVVAEDPMLCAIVRLEPHDASTRNVTGTLTIVQNEKDGPVRVTGKVFGLTEGLHGFHVHEKGDLRKGCTSAGAHFNPGKMHHGGPNDVSRHVGDLGNIRANNLGEATVDITDSVISLSGPNSILGRAIVVHSGEDDLGLGDSPLSLTTGNSGDRWACGIVGVLNF